MPNARTIFEQTSWHRPHPQTLLLRYETLCKITEYDYDLSDSEFVEYARSRGAMNTAFTAGSPHREYVKNYWLTEADYIADQRKGVSHAQLYEGYRYKYTEAERRSNWKLVRLARAKLQDCWEIYRRTAEPTPKPVPLGQATLF